MPVRAECTIPGFEQNWLEVDDVWSRRELTDYLAAKGAEYRAFWARKVTACHLSTIDGETVTDPAQVYERLDDFDVRLTGFVQQSVLRVTDHLLTLGGMSVRLSFAGAGEAAKTTKMTAPS